MLYALLYLGHGAPFSPPHFNFILFLITPHTSIFIRVWWPPNPAMMQCWLARVRITDGPYLSSVFSPPPLTYPYGTFFFYDTLMGPFFFFGQVMGPFDSLPHHPCHGLSSPTLLTWAYSPYSSSFCGALVD